MVHLVPRILFSSRKWKTRRHWKNKLKMSRTKPPFIGGLRKSLLYWSNRRSASSMQSSIRNSRGAYRLFGDPHRRAPSLDLDDQKLSGAINVSARRLL